MPTQIRFLHAYPPAKSFLLAEDGEVDIMLDEDMIAEGLRFGETSDFIIVEAGRGVLSVYPAGSREQALVSNRVIVPESGFYTLVLADRDGVPVVATVQEGEAALPEGYNGVRFGHLVSGADPIRILLVDRFEQSESVYEDVEYGQITEYIMGQQAPVAFDIYTDASEERFIRVPWQQYKEGVPYTIFLLGPISGEENAKIITLEENQG